MKLPDNRYTLYPQQAITNDDTEVRLGYAIYNTLHYYVQVYNSGVLYGTGYLNYTNYYPSLQEAEESYNREISRYGGKYVTPSLEAGAQA